MSSRWNGGLAVSLLLTIVTFSYPAIANPSDPQSLISRQELEFPPCAADCLRGLQQDPGFCQRNDIVTPVGACISVTCSDGKLLQQTTQFADKLCPGRIDLPPSPSATASDLVVASSTTTTTTAQTQSPTNTGGSDENKEEQEKTDSSKTKNSSELSTPIIVGIAVGGTVFLLGCVGLYFLIRCLKKRNRKDRSEVGRAKGRHSSESELVGSRGIPLSSRADKKDWTIDIESKGASMYSDPTDKPRLTPLKTNFKPVPAIPTAAPQKDGAFRPDSPISPVSPISHGDYDDRRSKAFSTVSSIKNDERTHRDFYSFGSPPLPTPAPGTNAYNHLSSQNPAFFVTAPSESNQDPVSPLSRNPSGKSIGARSSVSAIGEDYSWETYRDMIRRYEQENPAPAPPQIPQSAVVQESHRMSGLSQFNFGFSSTNSPIDQEEKSRKRISSFYGGWGSKRNSMYLNGPTNKKDKYLSGSSSIYSQNPPVTPPPPITNPGPSTPEMFSGRPPPSYTPPSPPPNNERYNTTNVRQPYSRNDDQGMPTGGRARTNSLRWRREVEAAADVALERIETNSRQPKSRQ